MASATSRRVALWVLEGVPRSLWGFSPRLMPVVVDRLGPGRALGWFLVNMPRYQRTRRAYGGLRTNLLATTISLVNGCRYCAFGHALAVQLIHLRERGALLAVDEHELTELAGLPRGELRRGLRERLEDAGLHTELAWVDRTLDLVPGADGPDSLLDRADAAGCRGEEQSGLAGSHDARIGHLVAMFGVLNACGILGDVPPDQAHDPVNRDSALKHRYALLRAEPSG